MRLAKDLGACQTNSCLCLKADRSNEPTFVSSSSSYCDEQILGMEGASQGARTRHLALTNLAVVKQEVGDVEGAIEGYRQVLV